MGDVNERASERTSARERETSTEHQSTRLRSSFLSSGALERDTLSGISTEPSPTNWPTCEQQGRGEGRGSWKPEGEKNENAPAFFPNRVVVASPWYRNPRIQGNALGAVKGLVLGFKAAPTFVYFCK